MKLKNSIKRSVEYAGVNFNTENFNKMFSKAKIYIMYTGKNRNYTSFSKESVERAKNSLFNTPIVGEFKYRVNDESNFGSHGGKLEITEDSFRFIQTTNAIGVVPESANIYWQTVTDEKEREREYLVVDGALIWNRYSEEVDTLKNDNFGQSMEIEITDGEYNYEEDTFEVKDFLFSALCILGIDKGGEGFVAPCFEDAKIITYSQDSLKNQINEMMNELKFSLSGGEKVTLEALLKKYSVTIEDLNEKEINFSEMSLDDLDVLLAEKFETVVEPVIEPVIETVEEPVVETVIESVVEPEPETESQKEESSTEDVEDLKGQLFTAQEELKSLKETIESMIDYEELKQFKKDTLDKEHRLEVEKIVSKFQLEKDVEINSLVEMTLEQVEKECYALLGMKMAQKQFSHKKPTKIDLVLEPQKQIESPYGDLL